MISHDSEDQLQLSFSAKKVSHLGQKVFIWIVLNRPRGQFITASISYRHVAPGFQNLPSPPYTLEQICRTAP